LICNHNLFDLHAPGVPPDEEDTWVGVLNSTLVGLFKTFYGRYAGTEGALKTEVVDVNLLEVPEPRQARPEIRSRISSATRSISSREVGGFAETALMNCHSPECARKLATRPIELPEELRQPDRRELDEAVFELLGVTNATARRDYVNRLYREVAGFFRQIRLVEIQKQEQRTKTKARRFSAEELAADIWDGLAPDERKPLSEWLAEQPGEKREVAVVAGPAELAEPTALLDTNTVYFGRRKQRTHKGYPDRATAEFVAELSNAGFHGRAALPVGEHACHRALEAFRSRTEKLDARFEELAASRTGTESLAEGVVRTLVRWSLFGR
jgi:hypothetical protein